jgi:hypothetical protein
VPNSSKREKFRELAQSRTSKALEAIERLGNLSNRQLYEWEPAEIKKIVKALREEIVRVEGRFQTPTSRRVRKFEL